MPCSTSDNAIGVTLSLFIVITCLSVLGILYSAAFLIFTIMYRKNKMIKMTSPNINIVILLGSIIGYSSIVIAGLSTSAALQACSFLATMAFTLVYGSLFAKVCRVFMIFSSLSFNGKTSRDEHLLLAVLMLLLLDLVILLPWQLTDPITCEYWQSFTEPQSPANATTSANWSCSVVLTCSSRLQIVWISVIYIYKSLILAAGLYFTWNTRQVTLPALKDAVSLATIVLTVVVVSITAMPALLTASSAVSSVSSTTNTTRYAVCSVAVWLGLTSTLSLLFIPKIVLVRRVQQQTQQTATVEDTQLQFSESMRARESTNSCWPCLTSSSQSNDAEQYAVEVLATEIYTLKRTVKEKDATIRELTDRLYVGAEQFHRYLTSSTRAAERILPHRTTSTNAISPEAPVFEDEHRAAAGRPCYEESSNGSSSDGDDDDVRFQHQQQQQQSRRPQQLNASNLLTQRQQCRPSDIQHDQQSVVGMQEDSAYENPSIQSSSTDATTTRGNGSSRSSAVAVIHCQPITATAVDFRHDKHVTVANSNTTQAMTSTNLAGRSTYVYKPFAVYQI